MLKGGAAGTALPGAVVAGAAWAAWAAGPPASGRGAISSVTPVAAVASVPRVSLVIGVFGRGRPFLEPVRQELQIEFRRRFTHKARY